MKNNPFIRILSFVLVLALLLQIFPVQVFAASGGSDAVAMDQPSEVPADDTKAEDPYVLEEITEKRTEFTKAFRLSNGLNIAAVYPNAVHYKENGTWNEIDNSLQPELRNSERVYTNKAGNLKVQFPHELNSGSSISVSMDEHTISFCMAGELRTPDGQNTESAAVFSHKPTNYAAYSHREANLSVARMEEVDMTASKKDAEYPEMVAQKLSSRMRYSDVYENTDIVYDLNSNQLKESIILERYDSALHGYGFVLEVDNLLPVLTENGSIKLYDEAGNTQIMSMPAPYLLDAAGDDCFDVEVKLVEEEGNYLLSYILPQEWLADAERVWPVVLDPIVEKKAANASAQDQTVYVNQYTALDANATSVTCGYNPETGPLHFYMQYNELPALTSADVILYANITLYANASANSTATVIEVHEVTKEWTENGLRWEDVNAYQTSVEDYVVCNATGPWTWDITNLVREWYTGANYGMVFKASGEIEDEKENNWKRFCSVETPDVACKPVLSIFYRNNNGLESYWDYTSSTAGRAGTGYVNQYSGNLVWIHEDLGFGGYRMPVSISHIYNSNDIGENKFGVGYGWRTNFNQLVYQWNHADAAGDYYVWEDGDGTLHYFRKKSGGTYKDEDGLELTLTTSSSGNKFYCITDKYDNKSYFDSHGRLTQQDNNQETASSIIVSYMDGSNKISSITDSVGRIYNFDYVNGLLSRISYNSTDTREYSHVSYEYNDISELTDITDKDGQCCKFSYTSNHLLMSAQDVDGYKLTYAYNSQAADVPNRVVKISESSADADGGELNIVYEQNQTTFTDVSGNVQTIQFNNWGNTVSVQDTEGKAKYAQYAINDAKPAENDEAAAAADTSGTTAKGNQLLLSSKLQNTVGNVLNSSSFESGTANWTVIDSTVSMASSTAESFRGSRSLKMFQSTDAASGVKSPAFKVAAGETYTFSAYVKTNTGSAYIALSDGTDTVVSETMEAGTDWTRLEVTYTNSSSGYKFVCAQLLTNATGSSFIDCAQVEKAPAASRYNLVENGDFRYSTLWDSSSGKTTASAEGIEQAPAPELNEGIYKIIGNPLNKGRLLQTVNISGAEGDTFILGGWGKAQSVPLVTGDTREREFGLTATFFYTDGSYGKFVVRFNPYVTNWQYAAAPIVAAKAYSSIVVQLAYDYNANTAYFDGIQLYKELFGNSYTYDEKGNIISVVDLQGQTINYEYDDETNDLLTAQLPSGAKLTYTYDDYHNCRIQAWQDNLEGKYVFAIKKPWNPKIPGYGLLCEFQSKKLR